MKRSLSVVIGKRSVWFCTVVGGMGWNGDYSHFTYNSIASSLMDVMVDAIIFRIITDFSHLFIILGNL